MKEIDNVMEECNHNQVVCTYAQLNFGLMFPLEDDLARLMNEWGLPPIQVPIRCYMIYARAKKLEFCFKRRFGYEELRRIMRVTLRMEKGKLVVAHDSVHPKYNFHGFPKGLKLWDKKILLMEGDWNKTCYEVPNEYQYERFALEKPTKDAQVERNLAFYFDSGKDKRLFDLSYEDKIVEIIYNDEMEDEEINANTDTLEHPCRGLRERFKSKVIPRNEPRQQQQLNYAEESEGEQVPLGERQQQLLQGRFAKQDTELQVDKTATKEAQVRQQSRQEPTRQMPQKGVTRQIPSPGEGRDMPKHRPARGAHDPVNQKLLLREAAEKNEEIEQLPRQQEKERRGDAQLEHRVLPKALEGEQSAENEMLQQRLDEHEKWQRESNRNIWQQQTDEVQSLLPRTKPIVQTSRK
ncbi:hypothetical protein FRX31_005261 [Thalictrum thalictroides]|uniref:Uncharacterized protein n=1 Tax=Thalictrum thalictroides TaxID=46969 RepID=A0A7J6X6X4_THATH|nr:hypothetical protein FRX31_005261 [Thalictrum thalictroides]